MFALFCHPSRCIEVARCCCIVVTAVVIVVVDDDNDDDDGISISFRFFCVATRQLFCKRFFFVAAAVVVYSAPIIQKCAVVCPRHGSSSAALVVELSERCKRHSLVRWYCRTGLFLRRLWVAAITALVLGGIKCHIDGIETSSAIIGRMLMMALLMLEP